MEIAGIRSRVQQRDYRFSDHATRRMISRAIDRQEVEEAVLSGEIIEEYPDDKYSPSCLVLGTTGRGRPLHIQVSLPPSVVVITVYEPEADEWIELRLRR